MAQGQHTHAEIMSQPDVWAQVLSALHDREEETARRWRDVSPKQILFTGCGSTYYLSMTAASLMQRMTGIPARGAPASEIVLYPEQTVSQAEETLLVTLSRSGTTTETAAAISRFRQLGGKAIWGVTCYADTPVGLETDFALLAEAAQEQSVAQTRSFSSMLLLVQALAAIAGRESTEPLKRLPSLCASVLSQFGELAQRLGESQDIAKFFFLGSGSLYGMACEAMLKMKEMSISYSEAFHLMEFRHGPKSMVDAQALVVGLLSERARAHEAAVLSECMRMGGSGLALSMGEPGVDANWNVRLADDLPDWTQPALYLPVLQLMAYHRSLSKGLDPDNPRNLTAVVELDRDELVNS